MRGIAQMVGELDEPYRSTVLLRYFEGASAAEIARRQGVPAGTVRWRLKEALDQLRARLSREVDGDRARRALALAPLAPFAGGGGLMIPALKAAAVALAVAGGVTAGVVHHRHAAAPPSSPSPVAAPRQPPRPRKQPATTTSSAPTTPTSTASTTRRSPGAPPRPGRRLVQGLAHRRRRRAASTSDAAGATDAWNALDPPASKFIEYVCKRNDVTLPDGAPVL